MSFDKLPDEILLLILENCPAASTLVALISTIPQLFRLYRPKKAEIIAAVLHNQFGENLPKALSLLRSMELESHPSEDFENLTINHVKKLLQNNTSVDILIRESLDLQFGTWVQLTPCEAVRIRRGMYNFIHAAILSRNPPEPVNVQALDDFYESLSTAEVLEVLYILHCLRDLASDHVRRLSDYLYTQIIEGFIKTDFDRDDYLFSRVGSEDRKRWCQSAPWLLDLRKMIDLTAPISGLEFYKFHPGDVLASNGSWTRLAPYGCFIPPDEKLLDQIPNDYYLYANEARHTSLNALTGKNDLIVDIPSGFMIWDEDHQKQLLEKRSIPPNVNADQYIKEQRRKEDQTLEDRIRKWSWSTRGKHYPDLETRRREYPRGTPEVIRQIRDSRRLEEHLFRQRRDGYYIQMEPEVSLYDDNSTLFKIDWGMGILFPQTSPILRP